MVSLSQIARDLGVTFKIHMTSPFDIYNLLQPNAYDWRLTPYEEGLLYGRDATFCEQWAGNTQPDLQYLEITKKLRHAFRASQYVRCATNINLSGATYGVLFDKLFKPGPLLDSRVAHHLARLQSDYIAVTFRFQQLLGDFKEAGFQTLTVRDQRALIERCEAKLLEIYYKDAPKCVLVTSDSQSFLNLMSKHSFVYFVQGPRFHVDYHSGTSPEDYVNSFLDYLLLVKAQKIYSVVIGPMYDSGFPYRAALHYGHPFQRIVEDL
jgi:hypothetical protein